MGRCQQLVVGVTAKTLQPKGYGSPCTGSDCDYALRQDILIFQISPGTRTKHPGPIFARVGLFSGLLGSTRLWVCYAESLPDTCVAGRFCYNGNEWEEEYDAFFVSPEEMGEASWYSPGENAAHAKVLRLKAGDMVTVCDGQGRECNCTVSDVSPGQVSLVAHHWGTPRGEAVVRCGFSWPFPRRTSWSM